MSYKQVIEERMSHKLDKVEALIGELLAILHRHDLAIIGPALADLVAIWLACHHGENGQTDDEVRGERLKDWLAAMDSILPLRAEQLAKRR